jgi:hypothetical protein
MTTRNSTLLEATRISAQSLNARWVGHLAVYLLMVGLFCGIAHASTPGSFRGTVVEGEQGSPSAGWLYIRGRNGSIRRVDMSQATVAYDEGVPADERKSPAGEQLRVGAEVRVTAEQGSDGEWHASRIEIIRPAASTSRKERGTDDLVRPDLATAAY